MSRSTMKTGFPPVRGDKTADASGARLAHRGLPLYLKLILLLVIALMLSAGGNWMASQIDFQIFPRHGPMLEAILFGAVVIYILLMAIPFMPGIELGLGLMLLMGSKGAALVYLCTLVALCISFFIGRAVPSQLVYRLFRWLHLFKASELIAELEPLRHRERLELLQRKAPSRLAPFLLRHRHLAIAVALNLPGNALIGGGGGIGLITGMSKIVKFPAYIALLAVAIAPLPLWFFLHGA
ncbi:MAG: hypothetical protein KJN79_03830 [Gammaproteobacteria bacterium]|nr:hypothetical protein [Gammaproteobacteria bacterium]